MSDNPGGYVLLDRSCKAAVPFASRDITRQPLTGIRITPDYIEATDSYKLVRITHADGPSPLDFPKTPDVDDSPCGPIPPEGVIVDAQTVARALGDLPGKGRGTLPILQRVAVKPGDYTVALTVNDLDRAVTHTARRIEGAFPPIDDLLASATGPSGTISFNPRFLAQVAKAFCDFGATYVTLECRGSMKPALMRAKNTERQTMTVLLMPVRTAGDES